MVVGGGAIGVCVAHELARRGADVTLLERGEELASGASSGNAGLLCPSHSAPIANPDSLRNGLRWMLKPDSPFYLRPRPGVAPWIARFVREQGVQTNEVQRCFGLLPAFLAVADRRPLDVI